MQKEVLGEVYQRKDREMEEEVAVLLVEMVGQPRFIFLIHLLMEQFQVVGVELQKKAQKTQGQEQEMVGMEDLIQGQEEVMGLLLAVEVGEEVELIVVLVREMEEMVEMEKYI